jgi:hypothetical protein
MHEFKKCARESEAEGLSPEFPGSREVSIAATVSSSANSIKRCERVAPSRAASGFVRGEHTGFIGNLGFELAEHAGRPSDLSCYG